MGETPETFRYAVSETIRAHALTYPDASEGSSCVNRAFRAGAKNFAFLGEKDDECKLRLKLEESVPEIVARAADRPDRWQVGKGGWTLITFSPEDAPADDDLRRWITESFRLLAPKKLVAQLDA